MHSTFRSHLRDITQQGAQRRSASWSIDRKHAVANTLHLIYLRRIVQAFLLLSFILHKTPDWSTLFSPPKYYYRKTESDHGPSPKCSAFKVSRASDLFEDVTSSNKPSLPYSMLNMARSKMAGTGRMIVAMMVRIKERTGGSCCWIIKRVRGKETEGGPLSVQVLDGMGTYG